MRRSKRTSEERSGRNQPTNPLYRSIFTWWDPPTHLSQYLLSQNQDLNDCENLRARMQVIKNVPTVSSVENSYFAHPPTHFHCHPRRLRPGDLSPKINQPTQAAFTTPGPLPTPGYHSCTNADRCTMQAVDWQ